MFARRIAIWAATRGSGRDNARLCTRTTLERGRLGGGFFALRGPDDAGEHRSGVAMQDLFARILADLRFRERLPGPVATEPGAVGPPHDRPGAVETTTRLI